MKKPTIRRILAYLFDLIIVALIASALSSVKVLNPYYERYQEAEEKVQTLLEESTKDPQKFNEAMNGDKAQELSYEISKAGVFVSIYTVGVSFLYFVVFQYYTKGKTLGKKILKLEIVSEDKEELRFSQLFKRSIIINSLVTTTISVIMLFALSKTSYLNYSRYIQLLDTALLIIPFGFVLYREDGRGLHDLFAGTRVLSSDDVTFFLRHEEVKEAQIVEEEPKKEVKKTVKRTSKKKESK